MDTSEGAPARKGSPLVGVAVIVLVLAVGWVVLVPGLRSSMRSSSERHASASLKTIATAEADFRANDRDFNKLNDFWTGDVKGLYTMTSAEVRGGPANSSTDVAIKLIELAVAAADGDTDLVPAGGENSDMASYSVPMAKAGFWFSAMTADGPEAYRQDTGGNPKMGACHHLTKFGFVALPDSLSASKEVFIVNEANKVYRGAVTTALNGRRPAPAWLQWPSAPELKKHWEEMILSH